MLRQPVGEPQGNRHEGLGLIGGVAKHDSLVASTQRVVGVEGGSIAGLQRLVDTRSDIRGLFTQGKVPIKTISVDAERLVGVADAANKIAHDFFHINIGCRGDFTSNMNHVPGA